MKSKNEKNIFNIYDAYIKCNTCWMWKKPKYANDKIIISIKSDYRDEFLNREFGLDDFNYKNVKSFSYSEWYNDSGFIFISLKRTGKMEVERAMKHFEKLYFVEFCSKSAYGYLI